MSAEEKKSPIKDRMVKQLMRGWHAERWRPLLERLGLGDEDTVERLVRLLILQVLIDRAVTAVIALKFLDPSSPSFVEIEARVARLSMGHRIDLAKVSKLISHTCADNMKAVNKVRNKIAHYEPQQGWSLNHVEEISSEEAFEKCTVKGFQALEEATNVILNFGTKA